MGSSNVLQQCFDDGSSLLEDVEISILYEERSNLNIAELEELSKKRVINFGKIDRLKLYFIQTKETNLDELDRLKCERWLEKFDKFVEKYEKDSCDWICLQINRLISMRGEIEAKLSSSRKEKSANQDEKLKTITLLYEYLNTLLFVIETRAGISTEVIEKVKQELKEYVGSLERNDDEIPPFMIKTSIPGFLKAKRKLKKKFNDDEKVILESFRKNVRSENNLLKRVNLNSIEMESLKQWMCKKILKLTGEDNPHLINNISTYFNKTKFPDSREIVLECKKLLDTKNTISFVLSLWDMLLITKGPVPIPEEMSDNQIAHSNEMRFHRKRKSESNPETEDLRNKLAKKRKKKEDIVELRKSKDKYESALNNIAKSKKKKKSRKELKEKIKKLKARCDEYEQRIHELEIGELAFQFYKIICDPNMEAVVDKFCTENKFPRQYLMEACAELSNKRHSKVHIFGSWSRKTFQAPDVEFVSSKAERFRYLDFYWAFEDF